MNKYRIKKYQGLYYVDVLEIKTETTGYLWWKKTNTTEKWTRCDMNGMPWVYVRFIPSLSVLLPPFVTSIDAKRKIDLFLKPIEYVYYPPNTDQYFTDKERDNIIDDIIDGKF